MFLLILKYLGSSIANSFKNMFAKLKYFINIVNFLLSNKIIRVF